MTQIRSRSARVLAAVLTIGVLTILMPSAAHASTGGRKNAPPVLFDPGMAYDAAAGQVVLFGVQENRTIAA
jgi:hypothetical protein